MPKAKANPIYVDSGRRGARTRWGPPRLVRLDGLTPEDRQTIVSLVDTLRKAAGDPDGSREPGHGRAA